MHRLMNFSYDYGSRAFRFNPLTRTDDWSRKPQPLLNLHINFRSCLEWPFYTDFTVLETIYSGCITLPF